MMLRFVAVAVACVWMILIGGAATAQPDSRAALVIGNAAYTHLPRLNNPVNDASAMADALGRLGFDVVLVTDADRTRMVKALGEFRKKMRTDGVALFYYAGHAVQVRGQNYLLPVDIDAASENDVRLLAFDQESVQNELEDAGIRLSLLVFDACRDNPFERRFRSAGSRGLARAEAARGAFVAYATAPGKTADDGDSGHGLYTAELLNAIVKPGLSLEEVFKETAAAVEKASGNRQTPWYNSAFHGNFYFSGPAENSAPPATATMPERTSTPALGPAPSPTAILAPPGPSTPAAPAPTPAAPVLSASYDGLWRGVRRCPEWKGRQSFEHPVTMTIENGKAASMSRFSAGTPGYLTYEGIVAQDGKLVLNGYGISSGTPGGVPLGSRFLFEYVGSISGDTYSAKDVGPRACTVEMSRMTRQH